MIAIDLSKQQALYTDTKAIQQINLTGILKKKKNVNDNKTVVFIIEEAKDTN